MCRGRQVRDGGAYGCAVPRAYANLNPGLTPLASLVQYVERNLLLADYLLRLQIYRCVQLSISELSHFEQCGG